MGDEKDFDKDFVQNNQEAVEDQIKRFTKELDPKFQKDKEEGVYTLQEYVATKTGRTTVMPKDIVERYLADVLNQIKLGLDVVYYDGLNPKNKDIKALESVKGLFVIVEHECETVKELLDPYHDASLNKKHRYVRGINKVFLENIYPHKKKLLSAKRTNNKAVTEFVKEVIEFLSAFHIILSEATDKKERTKTYKAYCGI